MNTQPELKEQMTIVIVGHVDHGKSTVIGRLLADTGSLPQGKLDEVKARCSRNARPFEYAFLLDALKDEQAQGITIDAARIFFNTKKRHYLIFDAPGHIEFLKNMVTGAAHAQAALLVIDAHEGIQENSRRHGFLLSMLGIKQVSVVVNKMDLAEYNKNVFDKIVSEYTSFLQGLSVEPVSFIPISAFYGENITVSSNKMPWYHGATVLEQLDNFAAWKNTESNVFRFPVQDIYKFTESNDDRRIVAGTIETGSIQVGDEAIFLPSNKKIKITSIEEFNKSPQSIASAGQAVGFTFSPQVYIKPGELMAKVNEMLPQVSLRFKANIFWMGKTPLVKNKRYRLKTSAARVFSRIVAINKVIDASDLGSSDKQEVDAHEVAEVIIETEKPIAFDNVCDNEATGRFVLVDNYDIAGGGIILEAFDNTASLLDEYVKVREFSWVKSAVSIEQRTKALEQKATFVFITGVPDTGKIALARELEKRLIGLGYVAYYLGISNLISGLNSDMVDSAYQDKSEHLRRLGELAHIITDAGLIFIATASDADEFDINRIRKLTAPAATLIVSVAELPGADIVINLPYSLEKVVEGIIKRL